MIKSLLLLLLNEIMSNKETKMKHFQTKKQQSKLEGKNKTFPFMNRLNLQIVVFYCIKQSLIESFYDIFQLTLVFYFSPFSGHKIDKSCHPSSHHLSHIRPINYFVHESSKLSGSLSSH